MATLATPMMTWEAFEQLPDSDGFHRELIRGQLQILPPPKSRHSKIARKISKLLESIEADDQAQIYLEAGYKLTERPTTWVQPDVSVLTTDRANAVGDDQHFKGAPEIAVEIISPSESAADVEQKASLLLAAGCQTLWVVYPKTQTVHVFTPGGRATICGINDMLPALPLGPENRIPVTKLFED
jgi:Uma2 family endonuclease